MFSILMSIRLSSNAASSSSLERPVKALINAFMIVSCSVGSLGASVKEKADKSLQQTLVVVKVRMEYGPVAKRGVPRDRDKRAKHDRDDPLIACCRRTKNREEPLH